MNSNLPCLVSGDTSVSPQVGDHLPLRLIVTSGPAAIGRVGRAVYGYSCQTGWMESLSCSQEHTLFPLRAVTIAEAA